MPEPKKDDKNVSGKDTPPGGTNPINNGNTGGEFDPTKLSDEQLSKVLEDPRIWKTERLSELRDSQKELKKRQKSDTDAENKRLTDEGKYKELLEKQTKEIETANKRAENAELNNRIIEAVSKKGIKDTDASLKLIERAGISKGEDGNYSGITEAVESLAKDRPYLINQTSIGNPSNPGDSNVGAKKYNLSEMTPEQYNDPKIRKDFLKAQGEGRVIDDRVVTTPV